MAFLFYVRLIALTAGTLVYLFLIALILGHRRPRLFERLLFFLALALLAIYGGGLLQINATIQYGTPPEATALLSDFLATLGLLALYPLIWHAHVEYVRTIQQKRISRVVWVGVVCMYALVLVEIVGVAVVSYRLHRGMARSWWGSRSAAPISISAA